MMYAGVGILRCVFYFIFFVFFPWSFSLLSLTGCVLLLSSELECDGQEELEWIMDSFVNILSFAIRHCQRKTPVARTLSGVWIFPPLLYTRMCGKDDLFIQYQQNLNSHYIPLPPVLRLTTTYRSMTHWAPVTNQEPDHGPGESCPERWRWACSLRRQGFGEVQRLPGSKAPIITGDGGFKAEKNGMA
ncbi:hypothetical protein P175DRAFT_0340306 [Aspergillus ochraceoroseus IBT 24754]|uniref:Uncharacterized protein n=1 Tax=Aspergillus ochraceoroseus IBT 24754 TaxID=1392256 RepID=A0A2T5LRN7_9EURO|nr:uncharacterized protein P175DRAFT_0340306 [Aspergillus ochraceoroseus IBT 24754]PTU18947.1 hypothetical protein P175DRAFT_0340306 [Aspergillus ochraceoroseus IBT 24754]